jgi:uncharacterized membrane protein YbhN (UPF0104 family)
VGVRERRGDDAAPVRDVGHQNPDLPKEVDALGMRRKTLWSVLILVIVLGGMVWYLASQPKLFEALGNVSLSAAVYLIGLRLLFLGTNGLFLRAFAFKFGIRLAPKEWFGLSVVTTMGNYITPFSGGLIARAAYLKRRHAFPYAQFATMLASNYLVNFWVIGVVGVISLLAFEGMAGSYWHVILFFATVTVSISALVMFPSIRLPWNNRLANTFNTALEGWALVKNDWSLLARLVILSLINILLNGVSFWLAYDALGSPVHFTAALLVSLLAVFSVLVNVTPGNLGVQEAVVTVSSGLLGAGTSVGLLVALLIRAATLVVAFTLGPIFSIILTRELTTPQAGGLLPSLDMDQQDDASTAPN